MVRRAFYARTRPNLLLDRKNGSPPLAFYEKVLEICERLGRDEGDFTKLLEPQFIVPQIST